MQLVALSCSQRTEILGGWGSLRKHTWSTWASLQVKWLRQNTSMYSWEWNVAWYDHKALAHILLCLFRHSSILILCDSQVIESAQSLPNKPVATEHRRDCSGRTPTSQHSAPAQASEHAQIIRIPFLTASVQTWLHTSWNPQGPGSEQNEFDVERNSNQIIYLAKWEFGFCCGSTLQQRCWVAVALTSSLDQPLCILQRDKWRLAQPKRNK